ncbi:MAG: HAMP domain-containing protein [Nitrospirae bacterium]|nr:HAMP domain-containing protein [Nitrospirota bacterium]
MKLSIFARLVIGYLTIFILAMAVSVYAIVKLHQLQSVTRSIIVVDNRLIDYEHKLSEAILSLMMYERKFIIIKDEALHNQFILTSNDFDRYLDGIMSVADTAEAKDILKMVKKNYQHYQSLFTHEVEYSRTGQQYSVDKYKEEKENAVNIIMEGLKKLRDYNQQNIYDKVIQLSQAEADAGSFAIVIGVIALAIGIMVSVIITISITKPLSLIKKKTREIAGGDFGSDLKLLSPPEIAELAQAFNIMCAKLKELDKMKSDFISLMSHELRTPLTTIKEGTNLFFEALKEGEATAKERRLLTIINEECNRLINLVNSLLDLSKMEAGMMVYNFTEEDIASLIDKAAREIEPLAENRNIRIEVSSNGALPPVKADIDKMLQVLRNLIGNAVKFTPNGGSVQIISQAAAGKVKVSVVDTGVGIPKEKTDIIFDKFKRATIGSSDKFSGSGLGLFIVRQILIAHGGEIWVESTLGKGSTFTFVLPA